MVLNQNLTTMFFWKYWKQRRAAEKKMFFTQLLPLGVATADYWSAYLIWHRFYTGFPS